MFINIYTLLSIKNNCNLHCNINYNYLNYKKNNKINELDELNIFNEYNLYIDKVYGILYKQIIYNFLLKKNINYLINSIYIINLYKIFIKYKYKFNNINLISNKKIKLIKFSVIKFKNDFNLFTLINDYINRKKWTLPLKKDIFNKYYYYKKGICVDIKNEQYIFSIFDGYVLYICKNLGKYKNIIIIKNKYNNYISIYANLDNILVKKNQEISIKQKIALVNNNIFYFEIRLYKKIIDPIKYFVRYNININNKT